MEAISGLPVFADSAGILCKNDIEGSVRANAPKRVHNVLRERGFWNTRVSRAAVLGMKRRMGGFLAEVGGHAHGSGCDGLDEGTFWRRFGPACAGGELCIR